MIPSSPRRTWLFLGITCLLYFGPDLLLPATWLQAARYPYLSAAYQGLLILLGFAYAPAICEAMVVRQVGDGPLRSAVDRVPALLPGAGFPLPPVIIAEHPIPFVLTAGLLPGHCRIFISSALISRLSLTGLRFLLARAAVHASLRHRMAALLPLLGFTVLPPDDPKGLLTWLLLGGCLALWLPLHWLFELDADRRAARLMGTGGEAGLREVEIATTSPLRKLTPSPPLRWRLRAVNHETMSRPG